MACDQNETKFYNTKMLKTCLKYTNSNINLVINLRHSGRGAGSFRFIQAPIRFSNATAGASSTQCFCKDSKYEGTFRANVECAICQAKQEDLSVHESNHFRSIVPFEIWIIPRKHSSHFHDIDPDMVIHSLSPSLPNCIAVAS